MVGLEYISTNRFTEKGFDRSLAKEKAEAERQLRQYASNPRIQQLARQVTVKKLAHVYKGWELV